MSKHQLVVTGPGTGHVQGNAVVFTIARAFRRFVVDGGYLASGFLRGELYILCTSLKHRKRETIFLFCFTLSCYPTYDLAGISFDVDLSQACRWVEQWLPILTRVLEREAVLPAKDVASGTKFLKLFHEVTEIYLDGTERPVQRPVEVERQKACFSGKKRHTVENLIVSDEHKRC